MTNIPHDARASAWYHGWLALEAASEQRMKILQHRMDTATTPEEHRAAYEDPMPANYWAVIAEANAYAALAQCPDAAIGMMAGAALEAREREGRDSLGPFLSPDDLGARSDGEHIQGPDEDDDETMSYIDYGDEPTTAP